MRYRNRHTIVVTAKVSFVYQAVERPVVWWCNCALSQANWIPTIVLNFRSQLVWAGRGDQHSKLISNVCAPVLGRYEDVTLARWVGGLWSSWSLHPAEMLSMTAWLPDHRIYICINPCPLMTTVSNCLTQRYARNLERTVRQTNRLTGGSRLQQLGDVISFCPMQSHFFFIFFFSLEIRLYEFSTDADSD